MPTESPLTVVPASTASVPNVQLQLSPEEMRRMGYAAVDMVVEHLTSIRKTKVMNFQSGAALDEMLVCAMPQTGTAPHQVLDELKTRVFENITHHDHPRFFAFVPGPGNFPGAVGEVLTNGFNVFTGTWIGGAGASEIELVTIDWLRRLCGFPETARGVFLSGGSEAGLVAMATARNVKLDNVTEGAVIYCSDQTHKSLDRDLWLLGFERSQITRIPSDENYRLDVAALRQKIRADRAAGLRPFCVMVNAGTTNTGSIDPLEEVADICEAEDLWLHADGAYGAGAIFCEQGQKLLKGLGRVNSLGLDPHKWMYQPYSAGCVIVHNGRDLRRTFTYRAEYLKLVEDSEERNFCDYGIQLTRDFRSLKLWISLKVFGAESFAAAQEYGMALAVEAQDLIAGLPDWEVTSQAQLAVVTFRYAPPNTTEEQRNGWNQMIAETLNLQGYAMVIFTQLRDTTVIRMCTINPRTQVEEIHATINKLDQIARDISTKSA